MLIRAVLAMTAALIALLYEEVLTEGFPPRLSADQNQFQRFERARRHSKDHARAFIPSQP
jgi:hypothetical protein